jgi:pilin isopeptide linkage protein
MDRSLKLKKKSILCVLIPTVIMLVTLAPLTAHAAADPLQITVTQTSTAADDTFTYRLRPLELDNPMPAGSTVDGYTFKITGSNSRDIEMPGYSEQGVYRYELLQVIDNEKPGYTYDRQVYTIEVYVNEGPRTELVVRYASGKKAEEIKFENSFTLVPTEKKLMVDPPVMKTVSGNPKYTTEFEFKLVARDSSCPMPDGSAGGTKTIKIKGSGKGEFGAWSYDRAGTYYYTVYEVDNGANGYTYDTAVYTITDTVTEENKELSVSRIVTNDANKPVSSLTFINKFSDGKPGPVTGDNMDIDFYAVMFAAGCVLAVGAALYLIISVRRKGGGKRI